MYTFVYFSPRMARSRLNARLFFSHLREFKGGLKRREMESENRDSKRRNYYSVTRVWQQVGRQQAGEARVQQPGAFLDPCTRTTLRRTARTRAGGESQRNGSLRWHRIRSTALSAERWTDEKCSRSVFYLFDHKIKNKNINIIFI